MRASSLVNAKPRRGARRTALGSSSPRPHPAASDVTYGIGISGSRSSALGTDRAVLVARQDEPAAGYG